MHLLIKIGGTNIPCICFDRVLVLFGMPASFPRIENNWLHRHFDFRYGVLFLSECYSVSILYEIYVERLQYWNCIFVTLFEYLINKKIKTVWSGVSLVDVTPRLGWTTWNWLSHCITMLCWFISFVYLMMMIMNVVQMW